MSLSTFSIVWPGINILFVVGIFVLVVPKFRRIISSISIDPIVAVVTKSEMAGAKNIPKNFVFQFEYKVGGMSYKNTPDTHNMHDFKAFVNRHPVGSNISIWVSEANPNFVLLHKPSKMSVFIKLLVPYALVWGGANYVVMKVGAHTI